MSLRFPKHFVLWGGVWLIMASLLVWEQTKHVRGVFRVKKVGEVHRPGEPLEPLENRYH